jgi:4-hydroxy-tetrahydrodipicolinate reductase
MTPERPYRVVQWATGNIGTRSLRAVIEHPRMTLVGVVVHNPDKTGRDAGELCGLGPVGVTATGAIDEILELDADCVLYMPQGCDVEALSRVLASGANVVTTRGEFHHPPSMDPGLRAQIEAACEAGASSIHSTGSSPGFISEAVPIVLASIERHLDELIIEEYADLSRRNSPELLFSLMGYGRDRAEFDTGRSAHGAQSFGPTLRLLAEALSMPLDSVVASGEVATARRRTTIAAGTIEAGTVAAQRMIVTGLRAGTPFLSFRAMWYCTDDLDPAWPVRATGWHVSVAGDAPLDVDIRFDVPIERMGEMSPGFTANRAVNVVPAVCGADPGIRTSVELPQIIPILS